MNSQTHFKKKFKKLNKIEINLMDIMSSDKTLSQRQKKYMLADEILYFLAEVNSQNNAMSRNTRGISVSSMDIYVQGIKTFRYTKDP